MEQFTSIKVECYINSAWADITADVLQVPAPRVSGMGIMGNTILDRTGDAGTFTFSLNNSNRNSASTLGYYTPEGVNKRTGWQPGLPVRLSFAYDGYSRYKYYGVIDNDGIKVVPGQYKERRVDVKCSNWMRKAANHTLALLQYQTNFRADQGIQCVLDNMPFQPQRTTLGIGATTFPTVFDITKTNSKALGEISKLVMSGLDYGFIRASDVTGEEFVFMPRATWVAKASSATSFPAKNSDFTDSILNETGGTDDILLETGDRLLLEHAYTANFNTSDRDNFTDLKLSYGKNMANHVVMKTYPRTVDASSVVLWSLETPITIAAAETLTETRGTYVDPNSGNSKVNGINMVTPVATTDYQMFDNADGTGTDRTANLTVVAEYGTSEVRYTLTSAAAGTAYITKLQARGTGVYIYDPAEKVYDSTTQQTTYGVMPLTVDMPYLDGVTNLYTISDKTYTAFFNGGLGTQLDKPMMTVDKVTFNVNKNARLMLAFLFLEPSDTLNLYETVSDDGGASTYVYWLSNWYITGYDFEIVDGKYVNWSPALKLQGLT